MAFHLHLINKLLDYVAAATPQLLLPAGHSSAEPRLCLQWALDDDGRLQVRRARV